MKKKHSPVWVGHGEASVISGIDAVFATRALGQDAYGDPEWFPWPHTAVYHSLEGRKQVKTSDIKKNVYSAYRPLSNFV